MLLSCCAVGVAYCEPLGNFIAAPVRFADLLSPPIAVCDRCTRYSRTIRNPRLRMREGVKVRLPCGTVRVGEKGSGGQDCSFDHVSDLSKPRRFFRLGRGRPHCLGRRLLILSKDSSASRDYCFTSSQLRFAETLPQSCFSFSMTPIISLTGLAHSADDSGI